MEWILLESLLALLIAVGVVWWTMRPARGTGPGRGDRDDTPAKGGPDAPRG